MIRFVTGFKMKQIFISLLIMLSFLFQPSILALANPDTPADKPAEDALTTTPSDSDNGETVPEFSWVDLTADVPDGFSGTVSVMLFRVEDGTYHTIICDDFSDFKSSSELPTGEYQVEHAYTSQDSFIYEAFIETDGFTLGKAVQDLLVTVKYNETGAAFIESPKSVIPEQATDSATSPSEEDVHLVPEESDSKAESPSLNGNEDVNHEKEMTPEGTQEPENNVLKIIRNICITLIGTAVFVGIVCGIVYFGRKKDY